SARAFDFALANRLEVLFQRGNRCLHLRLPVHGERAFGREWCLFHRIIISWMHGGSLIGLCLVQIAPGTRCSCSPMVLLVAASGRWDPHRLRRYQTRPSKYALKPAQFCEVVSDSGCSL